METTAKRIRELMEEQHISEKKLAGELQVSDSAMSNYLCSRRWLNADLVRSASICLHTSADYLLDLSDEKHPASMPDDECRILTLYRSLPEQGRRYLLDELKRLSRLCSQLTDDTARDAPGREKR